MAYGWTDVPDDLPEEDTTYRSKGVHKNRDNTAKMDVDPMDRNGVSDSEKRAMAEEAAAAAAEATAKSIENNQIGVDELIGTSQKDVGSEAVKSGHKMTFAATSRVQPGKYEILKGPGSGYQSGWGKEGTQDNPAADRAAANDVGGEKVIDTQNLQSREAMTFGGGFGMEDQIGGMMGGMGGGQQGGGGAGASSDSMDLEASQAAASYSGGGGGGMGGGGGGGGGAMSGLPAQVGMDIASKDDSIDRANNTLFEDDSARIAHELRAEREQNR